jgi:hypothetical protein
MNKNVLAGELLNIIKSLNVLVNNWDNDTQELFERFAVSPNSVWNIPSLDETVGEFNDFRDFVISSIKGNWHETYDEDGDINGYQVTAECPECHAELVEWHNIPKDNHALTCKNCA